MRTNGHHSPLYAKLALATLVGLLALVAGAGHASAAPAATLQATNGCWLEVINDWLKDGRVDRTYAIPCYTQAIQHLSGYTDVTQYSNAIDDIHAAMLAAMHQDHPGGPGNNSSGGSSGGGATPAAPTGPNDKDPPGTSKASPISNLGHTIGPKDARSVPLPLIVLGGLAVLLLVSGLVTWLLRRFQQTRRPGPTPAPAAATRRR
jgi:hypothetical protein